MNLIQLPLRVRRSTGSAYIEDASGRCIAYTYYREDDLAKSKRWTKDEATEIATLIARLVTNGVGS